MTMKKHHFLHSPPQKKQKVWRIQLRDYIIEYKLTDDRWFGKIAAEGLGAVVALLLAA